MYEKEFEFFKRDDIKEYIANLNFDKLLDIIYKNVYKNNIINIFLDNMINPWDYISEKNFHLRDLNLKTFITPKRMDILYTFSLRDSFFNLLAIHKNVKEIKSFAIFKCNIRTLVIGEDTTELGDDIFNLSKIDLLLIKKNSAIDKYLENGLNKTGEIKEIKYI